MKVALLQVFFILVYNGMELRERQIKAYSPPEGSKHSRTHWERSQWKSDSENLLSSKLRELRPSRVTATRQNRALGSSAPRPGSGAWTKSRKSAGVRSNSQGCLFHGQIRDFPERSLSVSASPVCQVKLMFPFKCGVFDITLLVSTLFCSVTVNYVLCGTLVPFGYYRNQKLMCTSFYY